MTKFSFLLIIPLFVAASCTHKATTTTQGDYYEDLSAYRPTYLSLDTLTTDASEVAVVDIEPEHDITDTLNAVLDSISVLSQSIRYVNGYTVQIYNGTNREAANIASGKAYTLLEESGSDLKPKVSYTAPNFKVQVGQFYSNLDAHTIHAQLLKDFPHAIVVLKKFRIKRN